MARPRLARPLRAVLLGASALALLAGCEAGQFGLSLRDAEWQRRGAFSVVSASPERAVVSARGQQVAVEPPPGFCLAEDSIETSDRSAFVLIGDCALENGAGVMPGADGALDLPPGMPGIITVSISGDPGFAASGATPEDLSALESYLETPEGRALLGRGGDGSEVSVIEARREGRILYVLVEDRAAQAVPLLATRFWRAFVELNDRLTVVTVSGFRDVPMDEDEMLRHLSGQVRQLQLANALPAEDAPILIAEATPRERFAETGSGDEIAVEVPDAAPGDAGVAGDAPADAWAETALAAADPGEAGEIGLAPDARPADEAAGDAWVVVAEAAGAEPTGAAGGPEPTDGGAWAATHANASAPVAWPAIGGIARPLPRPVVIASAASGALGAWPMPLARPRAAPSPPPAATAPDSPEPRQAARPEIPVPAPRLADPAGGLGQWPADAAVPIPPPRIRR